MLDRPPGILLLFHAHRLCPFLSLGLMGCLLMGSLAPAPCRGQVPSGDTFAEQRQDMVRLFLEGAGIDNERVLKVFRETKRHEFIPASMRPYAYRDAGLPIGHDQTISSPFIVAFMTQSLDPQPDDKVLEIGTGSGFQAAILSPLVAEVYSIEIVEPLGKQAAKTLERLGYKNVFTRIGDGFQGWPEHQPFDKIIVTCSPEKVPTPLVEQLKEGGLIVIPVGERHQQTLYLMRKKDGQLEREELRPTLFVPMTGTAEQRREVLPDPENPQILNGDFEEELGKNGFVKQWYYQRLLEEVEAPDAPSGLKFVRFSNELPGQASHVMQGFAVDGRKVNQLKLGGYFRGQNIVQGPEKNQLAQMAVTFYDQNRDEVGFAFIGPFRGTRGWRRYERSIKVPRAAREAIVRIGMFGATGTADFDKIEIEPVGQ